MKSPEFQALIEQLDELSETELSPTLGDGLNGQAAAVSG